MLRSTLLFVTEVSLRGARLHRERIAKSVPSKQMRFTLQKLFEDGP